MSQEFYLKTQALHEEFQKRELFYLNTERKLRNSIISKKEINLPYQEYLQRINEKEKESENTYKNIMKQMEELDQHTDAIFFKLEKLRVLRNTLTNLTLPKWPSNVGATNIQVYDPIKNFNSVPSTSTVEARSIFETNFKSITTQTENTVYCDRCDYFNQSKPKHIENESTSFINSQSRIDNESQFLYSEKSRVNSLDLRNIQDDSQLISPTEDSEHFVVSENVGYKSFSRENSKVDEQMQKEFSGEIGNSDEISSKKHTSVESGMNFESMENELGEHEKKIRELQHLENESCESKSSDVKTNKDTFITKSDAESMNNEFDFLELDTKAVSSAMQDQNNSKNQKSVSKDVDVSLDKETFSVIKHPAKSPLEYKEKDTINPNLKLDLDDNKSESSGSVSASHSPNMSMASDSDSIYGKGSPLRDSAAYQALLGNTVIPKSTKGDTPYSDSEDEVENALANVVQRSHVKSKLSKSNQVIETKSKPPSQEIEPKPIVNKGTKPPSLNKPQSKLSKNTKKVLGLDTSSGSEVELVLKPSEKKIDEDSDEFGFYD